MTDYTIEPVQIDTFVDKLKPRVAIRSRVCWTDEDRLTFAIFCRLSVAFVVGLSGMASFVVLLGAAI